MYFLLLMLVILCGCYRVFTCSMDKVDASYLASSYVGTPDYRQKNPPNGQRIIMTYWVPQEIFETKPHIDLHLLFWNNTTQTITYPIRHQGGSKVYFLLDKDFAEKRGVLTYKVDIVKGDGKLYDEWKHQLWVNLVNVEEEMPALPLPPAPTEMEENYHVNPVEEIYDEEEMSDDFFYPPSDMDPYLPLVPEREIQQSERDAESTNSSVIDQSKQGSVTDTVEQESGEAD